MKSPESRERFLAKWDTFVESRSLPYFVDDHQLMMRQVLERYPPGKLGDLSDRDLMDSVNLGSESSNTQLRRSFKYFLGHFDQFLERTDLER
ncbi:MAG: hypothetical protein ABEK50_08055 [bacterium]